MDHFFLIKNIEQQQGYLDGLQEYPLVDVISLQQSIVTYQMAYNCEAILHNSTGSINQPTC